MSCNKVVFNSKSFAQLEIKRMKNSYNQKSKYLGSKSRPYLCPKCLNFHLTTMSAVEIKRNHYIKEQKRRLRILRSIQGGDIDLLWELQEYWMLLITKEKVWILECKISGVTHYVKYYK